MLCMLIFLLYLQSPSMYRVLPACREQSKNAMCTARAVRCRRRLTNDVTDAVPSSLASVTTSALSPAGTSPMNHSANEDRLSR